MTNKSTQRIEELTQRITAARERLNAAFDQIGDRADEQIYSEGAQWTLRQLAIHLALADAGHNNMLYHYAEGKPFIPADYDLERYNQRSVEKRADMTLQQARDALAKSREELHTWLATVDDSVLEKRGRHPAKDDVTLEWIMRAMAQHEAGHAADIEALLAQE